MLGQKSVRYELDVHGLKKIFQEDNSMSVYLVSSKTEKEDEKFDGPILSLYVYIISQF